MVEYEKDAIVHSYVTEFIRDNLAPNSGILAELEEYAEKNNVPIVQPETAKLISSLCYMKRPKRILEVGCAIGYSAILLSQGLAEDGHITTVEYDSDMVKIARENIKRAGLSDKINVVEADAKDYIPSVFRLEAFDYIFLDGPKAHYIYMLDDCVRLLTKGGILVSDNVFYKGMTTTDDLVIRRKITIVKRLRRFIAALTDNKELETALVPIGDGVTISVKK